MSVSLPVDAQTLATVTVTFNPDVALLEAQLRALPAACLKFVVDNASRPELASQVEVAAGRFENVHLLRNDSNLGLAAAVNHGVKAVSELPMPPRFVLLLDQDSEPLVGSIEALINAFQGLEAEGHNVGCVGPLLRDPGTGLTHGFHQCTRWRWKRVYPPIGSAIPVACANLNGSGTLVPVSLFQRLHGLEEPLFIDHVDTEWAFRVLASGYTLWGVPDAVFNHRMGQSSFRFWCFGWRLWPVRSPQRHYFLYRNAIALMRRDYVPSMWKIWATVKLFLTLLVALITGPSRWQQCRRVVAAIWSGLKYHAPSE